MLYRIDYANAPADSVELLLFRNVRNSAVVRAAVLSGEVDMAVANAELVRSTLPQETRPYGTRNETRAWG